MKKTNNWKLKNYQGWANYYTWNIMLYLNNDYSLYKALQEWKKAVINKQVKKSYKSLISFLGLENASTIDDVSFTNRNIKRMEIINAIFEN